MRCPYCGDVSDKVVDSRENDDGTVIRRRRECLSCGKRFTTYEHVELAPLFVTKRDGRREAFDRNKVIGGIIKACEKRPVSIEKIERIVEDIEKALRSKADMEVSSKDIGEMVMDKLAILDEVAYVRFASVYRQFKDVRQFMRELEGMFGDDVRKGKG